MAGSWTTSPRTPTWTAPQTIGDGTNAQGGDPPVLAYEPAAINESTNYTQGDWLTSSGVDRIDAGEAKFRITCEFSHFGEFDPLLHPGMAHSGHHHTFIGNMGTDGNSTYESLRNNPASTCSGGPLNGTAYWEPTLFFEAATGIHFPVKPNITSFYYTIQPYSETTKLYRLLRGLTFIGGVDPNDRLNTARLAEIPDGQGWDKTRRYNGWLGWQLFDSSSTIVPLASGNTADENPQWPHSARQLVNADGSDPWGGAGEDPDCVLIANMIAPSEWDGHNLTSPNGRDHFRYPIRKTDNSYNDVGPDGWWKVPHFEVKSEFPNSRPGITGHAYRSKLYLSSDRYGLIEANWHPRGSTFHFDWMFGWDDDIINIWQKECTGTTIGGVAGTPLTCGNSTISSTQRMKVTEASPDPTMSLDPIITFRDYSTGPSKNAFGPLPAGTRVSGTVSR